MASSTWRDARSSFPPPTATVPSPCCATAAIRSPRCSTTPRSTTTRSWSGRSRRPPA
jgi:hypothetical protein